MTSMKNRTAEPVLDSYERAYHIRRFDNRIRVKISAHMGMPEATRHYHVSYEVLTSARAAEPQQPQPSQWQHVRGYTKVAVGEEDAQRLMRDLCSYAEDVVSREIPEWFSENFSIAANGAVQPKERMS